MVIIKIYKSTLSEQEKISPCNCNNKTTWSLIGSCQHKNLACSCRVSAADMKQNHPHYIGLIEHTFKDRPCKHSNSFKYE